jgi:uncharacterized protein (TIGR02217 family)
VSGFHDVQFPPDISYGASGGPGYSTSVITVSSGHERRNSNWQAARGRWNVAHGLKKREQVAQLIAFFRARRGRAYGFRFKDWTDFQGLAQVIGTGNGSLKTFQLVKNYASGGIIESRIITKPVAGSVKIYRNGVLVTSGVSVDAATGVVTFTTAPANGVIVTADYEFDVPARFDSDQMDITIETYALGSWGQIPVIEIRA